jgi:hypothetical protein
MVPMPSLYSCIDNEGPMIYTGRKCTNSAFAQKTKAAYISAEDHDIPFKDSIYSERMTTSPLIGQAPIAHREVVG